MPDNKHVNNPAYELEKEALRDEIQLGLEKGVGRLTKKADRFVEPDHFHNTKHLLKQYRRIAYGVRMAESEMNLRMELEHGVSLATTEANAELAGTDRADCAEQILSPRNAIRDTAVAGCRESRRRSAF